MVGDMSLADFIRWRIDFKGSLIFSEKNRPSLKRDLMTSHVIEFDEEARTEMAHLTELDPPLLLNLAQSARLPWESVLIEDDNIRGSVLFLQRIDHNPAHVLGTILSRVEGKNIWADPISCIINANHPGFADNEIRRLIRSRVLETFKSNKIPEEYYKELVDTRDLLDVYLLGSLFTVSPERTLSLPLQYNDPFIESRVQLAKYLSITPSPHSSEYRHYANSTPQYTSEGFDLLTGNWGFPRKCLMYLIVLGMSNAHHLADTRPRGHRIVKGKSAPYLAKSRMVIDLHRVFTDYIGTVTHTGAKKRAHMVRGFWRYYHKYHEVKPGCAHLWKPRATDDNKQECSHCKGWRTWLEESQRGDASIGFVTHNKVEVTAS